MWALVGWSQLCDLMFHKKTAQNVMHEQVYCCNEAANHQLPIAGAFWVIQVVSAEGCSSLTQNLMQLCCSAHSVILNTTATQYTCSLNSIYRPHWPAQWSCHCSRLCIPVHFPWLPGYIDVAQNFLVILTMAGLFQDRPYKQMLNQNAEEKISIPILTENWINSSQSKTLHL